MASEAAEIHIGDVGTVYQVPTYDNDLALANFDPTTATVKQLIFEMPGSGVLTRAATAAQVTIDGASVWCLMYTVVAADVVSGGFHQQPGAVKMQAYVEFSSAQKWRSGIVTKDQQNRPLQIVGNL